METITKTLGGERLGSGKKIKVDMHNWRRSTFNQSRIWRSTAGPGYCIPCFVEVGTNGTTFDINIDALGHTIPTIAPLFGSFKLQIDMFACPFRLYQGILHNNETEIGMEMSKVLLPKIIPTTLGETQKSSLLNYLGIKGYNPTIQPWFNAIPILAYYDIFKNYYANKQEENAKVLTSEEINVPIDIDGCVVFKNGTEVSTSLDKRQTNAWQINPTITITDNANDDGQDYVKIQFDINKPFLSDIQENAFVKLNNNINQNIIAEMKNGYVTMNNIKIGWTTFDKDGVFSIIINKANGFGNFTISGFEFENKSFQQKIIDFPLKNIDNARRKILSGTELDTEVVITDDPNADRIEIDFEPYSLNCSWDKVGELNGLCLKTYQSDIYNTWLSTEHVNLINQISSVAIEDGSFNIDALILAKKVYNVLNRIAVSGGTYGDWQEANWGEKAFNQTESPIYIGGMSSEICFDEVVSTASGEFNGEQQPLATLGGKGTLQGKKGGNIIYKCDEPCFIIGIVSITPRIDYSQGNKWFMTELDNMDNLHKPGLDGIGFQNLMSQNVHWNSKDAVAKQPAWIHYQTAYNEVFGNFAKIEGQENNQSFMVLQRDYNVDSKTNKITDFTSYIDPAKFNYAFASNETTSQNFWLQLAFDVKTRRKMAAYEIPNL